MPCYTGTRQHRPDRAQQGPEGRDNDHIWSSESMHACFVTAGCVPLSAPVCLLQADMFARASEEFEACKESASTWEEFMAALDRRHMVLAPW